MIPPDPLSFSHTVPASHPKVTGNHNRNPIFTCTPTTCFEARNACLLMHSSRPKHMIPLLSSLRLHITSTQYQLYWEPQSELNCLVHAYNMIRGDKLLTPDELHSHTCNNLQLDATYLHLVSLDPTDLCAARGDLSLHCLNIFCLITHNTTFIGKRKAFFTPVEAIFDALNIHGHRHLLLTASNSGPMDTLLQSGAMETVRTTCMTRFKCLLLSSMPSTFRGFEAPNSAIPHCCCWRYPGMPDTATRPRVSTHCVTPPSCGTIWTARHLGSTMERWQRTSVCH
jgi:hypothetical protein